MKNLKCKLCGFEGKSLSSHIVNKHGITCKEYIKVTGDTVIHIGSQRQTIYWINQGYSEEQAKEKVSEIQSRNNSKRGKYNDDNPIKWRYWVNRHGYTKEDALKKVHEIQSSRSIRSSRFEGKNHTKETKKNISINVSKHVQSVGVDNWVSHFGKFDGRSDKEIACYNFLKENICNDLQCNVIIKGQRIIVDMLFNNRIVEFNGDFWHANPIKYKATDKINFPGRPNTPASLIWKRDKKRIKRLEKLGYVVLIVWEYDWDRAKNKVIERIKKFLYQC